MSTGVPAPPPGTVPVAPPGVAVEPVEPPKVKDEEIYVYGHSNLFYWWPVWAVCFLMAALTFMDGHVMAVVPAGTEVKQERPGPDGRPQDALVTPPGQTVPPASAAAGSDPTPRLHVAANSNYGVIFTSVLLLVVTITNLTLRGLSSVIAIALLVIAVLLAAQMGWWDAIFRWIGWLDVRMNAGGYLAIGIPVLLLWLFSTFVYDRYTYLIITRGQVRVRREIGDGEVAVDTAGLLLEKKRDDLFRHWLLGLGSGDLKVKTGGPSNLNFELDNVLFVGSKLARIQELIREKEVT